MKISLLFELQREAGAPDYEYKAVHEAIEQIKLADQAGFDTVWTTEHHFLPNFCASPCNDVFLASLSQTTKRIKLGLGVVILPYHHPATVVERVGMLDILSNGRIELGTGRGGPYEQVGLGVDPRETRAMWDESVRMIGKCFQTEGEFAYEGKYWKMPSRTVLPKTLQKPHPPMWLSCLQPDTYQVAAERGLGVLSFNANTPAAVEPYIKAYRETIAKCTPVGAFANNNWANFSVGICGPDNRAARELGAKSVRTFFGPGKPYAAASASLFKDLFAQWGGQVPDHLKRAFSAFLAPGTVPDLTGAEAFNYSNAAGQQAVKAIWEQLDADTLCDTGSIIAGNPESCIKAIEQSEKVGADQVIMIMQTSTVTHQDVMTSIDQFGKHVIPHFQKKASAAKVPAKTR